MEEKPKQIARQILNYAGLDKRNPLCSREDFAAAIAILNSQLNNQKRVDSLKDKKI